jgi:hypothetical protein
MAQKKTAIFTLTERLTLGAGATSASSTIDLGSYVDVGDRQAIQIHSVDYIYQGNVPDGSIFGAVPGGSTVHAQVLDLNRGGLVFANDRALVSSSQLRIDLQGGCDNETDLYPDNFGKGSDDGRFVVNDQLYIELGTQAVTVASFNMVVRVNASIVSLSAKDFMALAIQSTAADN